MIDATCGNGNDTLVLSQFVLQKSGGRVWAFDKQQQAIEKTSALLAAHLSSEQLARVSLIRGCHSRLIEEIPPQSIQHIVYNLGYLPGGNKAITTKTETTLQSLTNALGLLKPGGSLSVTCYPGHREGKEEQEAVLRFFSSLSNGMWTICRHTWVNRPRAPSLFLLQKRM